MSPEEYEPRRRRKQSARQHYVDGFVTGVLAALLFVFILLSGRDLVPRMKALWSGNDEENEKKETTDVLTSAATREKLEEVERLINAYYLNGIDEENLSDYLFLGVAVGLDDKYADYYSKEDYEKTLKENEGVYFGVGCMLTQNAEDGSITVMDVYENTPAQRAGLQVGDRILAVDGETLEQVKLSDLVKRIRAMDRDFEMELSRPGEEGTRKIVIACERLEIQTVETRMLDETAGYLKLSEFDMISVDQFKKGVDRLLEQGAEKLIFDLRSNPGGMLTAVCEVVDYLLPEGLIMYTEDKKGNRQEYKSTNAHQVALPAAVLVDENSASGAEVFAGALQDRGAAVVIGTRTYGKGVVQNTFRLSDGSAIKFTISNYYTPAGKNIDGQGITPDYMVKEDTSTVSETLSDPAIKKALEVLRTNGTETDFS